MNVDCCANLSFWRLKKWAFWLLYFWNNSWFLISRNYIKIRGNSHNTLSHTGIQGYLTLFFKHPNGSKAVITLLIKRDSTRFPFENVIISWCLVFNRSYQNTNIWFLFLPVSWFQIAQHCKESLLWSNTRSPPVFHPPTSMLSALCAAPLCCSLWQRSINAGVM